jgi:hypothetical protein
VAHFVVLAREISQALRIQCCLQRAAFDFAGEFRLRVIKEEWVFANRAQANLLRPHAVIEERIHSGMTFAGSQLMLMPRSRRRHKDGLAASRIEHRSGSAFCCGTEQASMLPLGASCSES